MKTLLMTVAVSALIAAAPAAWAADTMRDQSGSSTTSSTQNRQASSPHRSSTTTGQHESMEQSRQDHSADELNRAELAKIGSQPGAQPQSSGSSGNMNPSYRSGAGAGASGTTGTTTSPGASTGTQPTWPGTNDNPMGDTEKYRPGRR